LQRDFPDSPYIFVSERGDPMTPNTARKTIRKSGEAAELQFLVHSIDFGTAAGTIWWPKR
jgi:type 1 fimbriae regulatory protein FimB/type 1 fimbriae regulatory protein FimE